MNRDYHISHYISFLRFFDVMVKVECVELEFVINLNAIEFDIDIVLFFSSISVDKSIFSAMLFMTDCSLVHFAYVC